MDRDVSTQLLVAWISRLIQRIQSQVVLPARPATVEVAAVIGVDAVVTVVDAVATVVAAVETAVTVDLALSVTAIAKLKQLPL